MQFIIALLGFLSFVLAFIGLADSDLLVTLAGITGLITALMHEEIAAP